ncbi:unnamed protein product [Schistosoma mattheei]|uniref:Uncharacterized protein n=1 Tax=Schistosoma mattheei TaxID=31246 RepID=A0A183NG47_9TREM|nr:unnamed protein product [Schistosoma mattheei]
MGRIFELLNRPVPPNPLNIKVAYTDIPLTIAPPTIEEISMTIRQIGSGKAVGLDNLPAEGLNSDIEATANMLHIVLKKIREERQVPTNWKGGRHMKIPKKGDLSKCRNYRRTILLLVPGKCFTRVFSRRPTSRTTGWILYGSTVHTPNHHTTDHR